MSNFNLKHIQVIPYAVCTCIKLEAFQNHQRNVQSMYWLILPCSLPVIVPRRPVVGVSGVCITPMPPVHGPMCPLKPLLLLCSLLLHSQPPSPVCSLSQSPLLQGGYKHCESYREDILSHIIGKALGSNTITN